MGTSFNDNRFVESSSKSRKKRLKPTRLVLRAN